jgi:hypothetical protein
VKRLAVPLLSVILLVAAAIAVLSYLSEEPQKARLVIAEIQGEVTVTGPDGSRQTGITGGVLKADDRVATGQASRAVLEIGDDTRIRLDPESTVQVGSQDDQSVTLELEGGALQATVRPGAAALRVGSRDRYVLTTDGSFEMGVGDDGILVVEMSEGQAMTSGFEGVSPQLSAGDRATVAADGTASIQPIAEELLLAVQWPEQKRTRETIRTVAGTTTPGARVRVEGGARSVESTADGAGRFELEVPLRSGRNDLRVEAIDQLGHTNSVDDWIEVDNHGPTFRGGVEYNRSAIEPGG